MSEVIYKYKLTKGVQDVELPKDAKILCAQNQDGIICLWAIVNPDKEKIQREFRIVGTGHVYDTLDGIYIGTVQVGILVWHVFEV